MDQFRQSINDWERRHQKVHHAARNEYHSMMLQAGTFEGGGGHLGHCSMSLHKRCARDVKANEHKDKCMRNKGRCRLQPEELRAHAKGRMEARRRNGGAAERPKSRPALNPFWRVDGKNVLVSKKFCIPWGSVDKDVEAKTGFMDTNEEFPNVVKNFKKMMSQRPYGGYIEKFNTMGWIQPGDMTYFDGQNNGMATSIRNTVKGIWDLNDDTYFYVEGDEEWNVLKHVDEPWNELERSWD